MLVRALREHWLPATLAIVASIVSTIIQVTFPALTGSAIDIATGNRGGSIAVVAWTMVVLAVAQYAMQFSRRYCAGLLANRAQHWVRVGLLRSLNRVDGPGQDEIVTGQVVSRSISDLGQFQMLLAIGPIMFSRFLQLILTIGIMVYVDWRLTALALAFLPLIVWVGNRSRHFLYAATWVNQQTSADLASHVEQTVSGIRVVKAFGAADREVAKLDRLGRALYAVKMRTSKLTARFQPTLSQLPNLALVVTIVMGGIITIRGGMTVGAFVAFTTYLTALTSSMSMLAGGYVTMQMGMSSVDRLDEVLSLSPQRTEPATPLPIPDAPVGIRFDGVHFSTGGHEVLNDLSFSVAPGESVAIIGPAGAGKSMAVQLAGGFYEPDAGEVSLLGPDGPLPYPDLSLHDIRQRVTCVFDEPFLFSSSIRDNIAMGATVSEEDIAHAARLARADEFITRLPDGYDTVVGERGLTLSGGQRQRIALARALLTRGTAPQDAQTHGQTSVLLLDDATSAIDAENEAAILTNLRRERGSIAIIAIAHRQSTVDHADRVIILDRGRVLIDGPRDAVMATAEYAALMDPAPPESQPRAQENAKRSEPPRELLWPADEPTGTTEHIDNPAAGALGAGMGGRGSGMGGGRGAGGAGAMASFAIAATPEILSRVDRLPPATEQPRPLPNLVRPPADADRFKVRDLFAAVKWLIAAVVVLLIVGVVADLAFPTLVRAAVDRGIEQSNTQALWLTAAAALAVVIIGWAANYCMTILSSRSGESLLYGLRLRSYAHLQTLGMSYFESHLSGRIMTRMTTDIDTLSGFLQTGLAQAIVSLATLLGVVVMLVATDGSLTVVALAAVPVIAIATIIFRRYSKRYYSRARTQISEVNGEFAELIGGIRASQMHLMEAPSEAAFESMSANYCRTRMKAQLAVALYFPGMQTITQVMTAAIVGVGATRVAEGSLSVGVLVAFTMYLNQLYGPLQQLGQIFDSWQQATVSFERISQLLATSTTVPDTGTKPGAAQAARGAIELHDVDFSYATKESSTAVASTAVENRTLEDIDITFKPGQTVALVGATGAGKSSVVKLIARFYDPTSGSVRASGTDIRDFPITDWRRAIAQVPQETYLFPDTVAANIAYGRPEATEAEIEDAVRRIGGLDVIAAIPGGFNRTLGERGRGLSSGQRQIIALARAEMLQPHVVLLDEATATLDPATERGVLEASSKIARGRTSIIVAHRLATARRADRILVMEGGRIIEDGTHETLVEAGGKYAVLWAINR
ncbi:ABC transporter ATP-binding protein [Corynebacterium aquatimens]